MKAIPWIILEQSLPYTHSLTLLYIIVSAGQDQETLVDASARSTYKGLELQVLTIVIQ